MLKLRLSDTTPARFVTDPESSLPRSETCNDLLPPDVIILFEIVIATGAEYLGVIWTAILSAVKFNGASTYNDVRGTKNDAEPDVNVTSIISEYVIGWNFNTACHSVPPGTDLYWYKTP